MSRVTTELKNRNRFQENAEKVPAAAPVPNTAAVQIPSAVPAPTPIPAAARTAQPVAPNVSLNQMPLGDVARYYRAQKEAQATVNAKSEANAKAGPIATPASPATSKTSFPMKIGTAPLAVMKATPKIVRISTADNAVKQPATRIVDARTPSHPKYLRDPFAPPTRMVQDIAPPIQPHEVQTHAAKSLASVIQPANFPVRVVRSLVPVTVDSTAPSLTRLVMRASQSLRVTRPAAVHPFLKVALPAAKRVGAPSGPAFAPKTHSLPRIVAAPRPNGARKPVSARNNAASLRVASGDSLWSIARRVFGTGTRWQELVSLNPGIRDPRKLQIGTELVVRPPSD